MSEKMCKSCSHQIVCLHASRDIKGCAYYEEARPHGEWLYHKEWAFDGECAFECSRCGMGSDVDYDFCMRCGADMRKEEGDPE